MRRKKRLLICLKVWVDKTLNISDCYKKKDLEATQEEGFNSDRENGKRKVVRNLSDINDNRTHFPEVASTLSGHRCTLDSRLRMDREIEEIKSTHEMDSFKPLEPIVDRKSHVKVAEKKCIFYETNDESTIDDDLDERIKFCLSLPVFVELDFDFDNQLPLYNSYLFPS
uniref:Ovule protein n=1 Tax=Elaeophora elaphi TaxID=1147741 RepID=A0A0R3RVQ5_9BILA